MALGDFRPQDTVVSHVKESQGAQAIATSKARRRVRLLAFLLALAWCSLELCENTSFRRWSRNMFKFLFIEALPDNQTAGGFHRGCLVRMDQGAWIAKPKPRRPMQTTIS